MSSYRLGLICAALLATCFPASANNLTPESCQFEIGTGTCDIVNTGTGKDANWNGISISGSANSGILILNPTDPEEFFLVSYVDLYASVLASGTFEEEALPIHVAFNTQSASQGLYDWGLTISLGNSTIYSNSGLAAYGEEVTFDGFTSVLNGLQDSRMNIALITQSFDLTPYSLTIPGSASIDINVGAPEPASVLTALGGLAGLLAFRKRR